ncbi:MAG: hypothetical protein M3R39_03515 [Actinomycetota bacterium]|nr:hypothetical protein [Actinomycetota bacterium]
MTTSFRSSFDPGAREPRRAKLAAAQAHQGKWLWIGISLTCGLRHADLLKRLSKPPAEETVEVLTRVPHVDHREALISLAGGMEGLTLAELTTAFFELAHDLVVLLQVPLRDVDRKTNRHRSSFATSLSEGGHSRANPIQGRSPVFGDLR